MAFKSDAHRRWWFANQGSGGDSGSGVGPGPGFVVMTDDEKSAAARARNDGRINRNDEVQPAEPRSIPQLTPEEKADWAAYRGDFGKK